MTEKFCDNHQCPFMHIVVSVDVTESDCIGCGVRLRFKNRMAENFVDAFEKLTETA
jgi:hypothetical protein